MHYDFQHTPNGLRSKNLERALKVPSEIYPIGHEVELNEEFLIKKSKEFGREQRCVISQVIQEQIGDNAHAKQLENITKLLDSDSLTITTGQQLHPFLGPLFVWSKIMTAVDLSVRYESMFGRPFIPIFWMATEDHDFEEIENVPFLGKTYTWKTNQTGAVGQFDTEGIQKLKDQIKVDFPNDQPLHDFLDRYASYYQKGVSLSKASTALVNEWFGHLGVLPLDPNDKSLKHSAKEIFFREVDGSNQVACEKQNSRLKSEGLPVTIGARNTRLFYLSDHQRLRIDEVEGAFQTQNVALQWTAEELRKEIDLHTERFSPNVLLRPIYQQFILPNVVYVAGPSEYLYWLQLPELFKVNELSIPKLHLRVLSTVTTASQRKKKEQLSIAPGDWFLPLDQLQIQLQNNDPKAKKLREQVTELSNYLDAVTRTLYDMHSPNLKEIKKDHKRMLKELQSELQLYLSGDKHTQLVEQSLKQLEKLKGGPYNEKSPFERSTFYLECIFKNKAIFNYQSLESDFVEIVIG